MKKLSAGSIPKKLNCPTHGPYEANVVVVDGHEFPGRCPECVQDDRALELERNRARAIRILLGRAQIPLRYRDRSFANYRESPPQARTVKQLCQSYANYFEERMRRGCGMILCGKPGTGKTHLVCSIAQQVVQRGRSVWYTTVAAAVREVKQTFSAGASSTEREALNRFYIPDLLILDEVGMQRGTEFELALLAEVMNERYSRVLPTIIATNLSSDELAKYIGERALDRMREGGGVVLALDWDSYRDKVDEDTALTWPSLEPVNFAEIASEA
jgi:DNA replication protein DnaC